MSALRPGARAAGFRIYEAINVRLAVGRVVIADLLVAAAGIEWYLLVEPELTDFGSVALRMFHLDGEHYVEQAVAAYGESLAGEQPFTFQLDTGSLLD